MKFELTILGCGSAVPTLTRNATAQVLNVLERYFLIDCGEGTQHQLRKYKIPYNKINHIFISHLHGDHFFGLIGFLSSLSMQNRRAEMHIYADSRLEKLLNFQFELLKTRIGYPLIFHSLNKQEEIIYDDKCVFVRSFPLKHRFEAPSWGFVFEEKPRLRSVNNEMAKAWKVPVAFMQYLQQGLDFETPDGVIVPNSALTYNPPKVRSYGFMTDTLYRERFADYVKDVDLLYHEATYAKDMEQLAKATFHSTAEQAAMLAKRANVKRLIIGHYSARYFDVTPLVEEARQIFPNTIPGMEGEKYSVELQKTH